MAIYHLSVKIISRTSGRSSLGASAYRAGEKLKNNHDGVVHDYQKKKGIVYTEVLLPENAPKEFENREFLWNMVEKTEKRRTAQLAREIEIALPVELSLEEQKKLVLGYVKDNFVSKGMCADVAIHDKKDGNPHAHIMLTMRSMDERGAFMPKSRFIYELDKKGDKIYNAKNRQYRGYKENVTDWDNRDKVELWRKNWAESVNQKMKELKIGEEIDHRSFERQEKEQIPTIHLGSSAHQLEKRGIRTERGNINREIRKSNDDILLIDAKLFLNLIDRDYVRGLQRDKKKAEKKPLSERVEEFRSKERKIIQIENQIETRKQKKRKLQQAGNKAVEQKTEMLKTFEVIKYKNKEIRSLKAEIEQLEESHIPVFRNNKGQIEYLREKLEQKEQEYSKINYEFRKEYEIEYITDKSVEERVDKYKVAYETAKANFMEIGGYQELEKEKMEIMEEYQKELVIAEVGEDFELLEKELFKSNSQEGFNLSVWHARTVSNTTRLEVAEELSQSNPGLSEKILEGVEKNTSQENEMDYELEL